MLQRGDQVVWWTYNAIWTCPLAGGEAVELTPGLEKDPDEVVADATHVYWSSAGDPGIWRLALSGQDPIETLVTDIMPQALALDTEHLYFAADMRVQRMALNLGAPGAPEDFAEVMDWPYYWPKSLLAAGDFLYLSESGDQQFHCIKRVPK